jgi:hypothetical protein
MKFSKTLSRDEMKNVMAGADSIKGDCCLRCDQSGSECDARVSDCSRETASQYCNDLSNAVCVCV